MLSFRNYLASQHKNACAAIEHKTLSNPDEYQLYLGNAFLYKRTTGLSQLPTKITSEELDKSIYLKNRKRSVDRRVLLLSSTWN